MINRIIRFKQDALLVPRIYEAMIEDGIETWSKTGPNHTFVEVHDTKAVDFPNIREALKSEGFSYDFYQRRTQDGDHTMWHHSRNGRAEIYSNFGRSEEPYGVLFDCKR